MIKKTDSLKHFDVAGARFGAGAWGGNVVETDCKLISDKRALIVKSALKMADLNRLSKRTDGNMIKSARIAEDLFSDFLKSNWESINMIGHIGNLVAIEFQGRLVNYDANRLRYIARVSRATCFKMSAGQDNLLGCFDGDKPVAFLMARVAPVETNLVLNAIEALVPWPIEDPDSQAIGADYLTEHGFHGAASVLVNYQTFKSGE